MAVLRLMTWLSLVLGRRFSRIILYPIAAYFVLFSPQAKRASKHYLHRVLHRPVDIRDGFRHVLSFASVVHDRIYWLRDRTELFDVSITGEPLVAELRQSGRGVIFMGAQVGSFEALRMLGNRHGLDVRMLMYPDNARMVTQTLAAINPSVRDHVIALGRSDAILRVRDHLQEGGCVGILADRHLKEDHDKARQIEFLGAPASFPAGPFRLAALLRAPVVFMAGMYLGENRYHLHFEHIADFADVSPQERETVMQQAQERFVLLLEERCREAPWNWFNFYDFWNASPD
jgi:predicted LPLAT superfamily acyltransferase